MRLRAMFTAALTGALLVGSVWAGAVLRPVGGIEDVAGQLLPGTGSTSPAIGEGVTLGADELLVGAAKVSISPAPDAAKGEIWVRDKPKCTPATSGDVNESLTHVADWRTPWIENTNCIYMGGFGIGPSQPVITWDDYTTDPVMIPDPTDPILNPPIVNPRGYGLWSRSVALIRDGKAVVLTILDGEGYFAAYNRLCPPEKACGSADLAQQLGTELGLDPASFVFASTHAHSAMDFIGGWGAVPTWYMRQVAEAMRESVRQAVNTAQPATLQAGDTFARGNNGERRDTYRSAEDPSVNWIRATARDGSTIATVGTFAAHATSFGGSATLAHADWPGVFDKRVEERFGGIGLMFEAGLGNMSSRGGYRMGRTIAELIPAWGELVRAPAVRVKQEFWDQPVTNVPLGTLGAGGFFDRPFTGPAVVEAGKSSVKPCRSASAVSVHVSVTAAKIGNVIVSAAPGEVFSNFTNTLEERDALTVLAIGQANDALGYMPQSFESDPIAREGPGFVGANFFEYEDAYSIDLCFGDKALETTLKLLGTL